MHGSALWIWNCRRLLFNKLLNQVFSWYFLRKRKTNENMFVKRKTVWYKTKSGTRKLPTLPALLSEFLQCFCLPWVSYCSDSLNIMTVFFLAKLSPTGKELFSWPMHWRRVIRQRRSLVEESLSLSEQPWTRSKSGKQVERLFCHLPQGTANKYRNTTRWPTHLFRLNQQRKHDCFEHNHLFWPKLGCDLNQLLVPKAWMW